MAQGDYASAVKAKQERISSYSPPSSQVGLARSSDFLQPALRVSEHLAAWRQGFQRRATEHSA